MKITEKLKAYQSGENIKPITFAFLGDSVTQGCFEIYPIREDKVKPVFEPESVYHTHLAQMLKTVFPGVMLQFINAGLSGTTAKEGLVRIERDVLCFCPDLTVVCFGLNDVNKGMDGLSEYISSLGGIFKKLEEAGGEVIFMTPNRMNDRVEYNLSDAHIKEVAEKTAKLQNEGVMDTYISEAIKKADDMGVPVCDCYGFWNRLHKSGADTTALLSNSINHPVRKMHELFASELFRMLFL